MKEVSFFVLFCSVFSFLVTAQILPPIAFPDYASINESSNAVVFVDVLANDIEPSSSENIFNDTVYVQQPLTGGSVFENGTGVYVTIDPFFYGTIFFWYNVTNPNSGFSSLSNVTIDVFQVFPVAVSDTFSVTENDLQTAFNVLSNDFTTLNGVTLSILNVDQPSNDCGTTSHNSTFVFFTPSNFFVGNCTFVYHITDSYGGTDYENVTVTINPETFNASFWSPIVCDYHLKNDVVFQKYITSILPLTWNGTLNICFEPGLYNPPNSTHVINSAQNWYGPNWNVDPTCNLNSTTNCPRAISSQIFDSSQESVFWLQPQSLFPQTTFYSFTNFHLYGFSIYTSNPTFLLFSISEGIIQNNYIYTDLPFDENENALVYPFLLQSGSIFNNLVEGYGVGFQVTTTSSASVLVQNNLFSSSQFGVLITQGNLIVTANKFYFCPQGLQINNGTASIYNNTFFGNEVSIYINLGIVNVFSNSFILGGGTEILVELSAFVIVDDNVFVFSQENAITYFYYPPSNITITNNIFAACSLSFALYGDNPTILANNDFIDSTILLDDSTWNISLSEVYGNYFGENGVFEILNTNKPTGNTKIAPSIYTTYSSTALPYTLTPNHQSLPKDFITNVQWTSLHGEPYFVENQLSTISFTFEISDWYYQYGLTTSDFTSQAPYVQFAIARGTNENPLISPTTPNNINIGNNTGSFFFYAAFVDSVGTQYGYYTAVYLFGLFYLVSSPHVVFTREPIAFAVQAYSSYGSYYSNEGDIEYTLYTDTNIYNITVSLKDTYNILPNIDILYLSNGTGLHVDYVLPAQLMTPQPRWYYSASFTISLTGVRFEINDGNIFGYVIVPECDVTLYINKAANTTITPNVKRLCSNTPNYPIAWSDTTLSGNKGLVNVSQNNEFFIVNTFANHSGIATWNFGLQAPTGEVFPMVGTVNITSYNPVHKTHWQNVTWSLQTNSSINVFQEVNFTSYSTLPIQVTGLYPGPKIRAQLDTLQVDNMTLYFKNEKVVLVAQQDGTLTLHEAIKNGQTYSAGSIISTPTRRYRLTFLVSVWAGDLDLNKTKDVVSITVFAN